ncbi:MAG: extracellular solute-binding protein [Chloroflexi bacterium]|nr:extracellular solute-binding protein [Chloroflexota bacterium]
MEARDNQAATLAGRRKMVFRLAAVPATALLAACGGATQQSSAPAAGPSGSTAQGAQTGGPKALPPATIAFETFRGGPNGVWAEEMIKTFQEKFPQIKVEHLPIALQGGQQSAYPKMLAAAAAGTLGEVHAWDPSHWQLYQAVRKGIIQPLDPFVARDKYDLTQFYKQFIEYQRFQGKLWGLPSWGWTGHDGLLYNTELIQQAGVTFPEQKSPDWTMDRLYEIAVKVGKFVERNKGFGLRTTMPGAIAVTIWTRAFDSDNLSPDGKKSTLLAPRSRDAMRWIYDLANKERVVALPSTYEGDIWMNGLLGIDQAGSLGVFNVNKKNTDGALKFKAQLLPKRKDGKRPSQLRGGTWNINKVNKAPDASWEFVKHIASREGTLTFNTIGGNGALVRPDIMSDDYFKDPNFRVFLENFENTIPAIVPANYRGTEFEDAFGKFGTPWYKGEVGFEDGLTQWNTELQRILDQPPE